MYISIRSIFITLHQFLFFNATPTTEIYTLSLHDALPICARRRAAGRFHQRPRRPGGEGVARAGAHHRAREPQGGRSEEHTSELQSRRDLVCRLLLEKKKKKYIIRNCKHNPHAHI